MWNAVRILKMEAAMSSVCCSRCWVPSATCKAGFLPKIASSFRKVGLSSSTMAPTSSATKRDTQNPSDDSLEAAVKALEFTGVHHVGLLCENVERSLKFYCGVLGLDINPTRPDEKLAFQGVWLNVGSPSQMIHLMQLPNPDPREGRPLHGGQDRHTCIAVKDLTKIKQVFNKAGVPYTFSPSGSKAIFARDPDGNALEFSQFK